MLTAAQVISALGLQPLPLEGGWYRETYRAADRLPAGSLPAYQAEKAASTAIFYLLTPDTCSVLHRLPTDEVFHYYAGSPVRMLQLFPDGRGQELLLGTDLLAGMCPQVVVPRGVWQGSLLEPGGSFALLGTTMAPGFDFADYEGGDRIRLLTEYPRYAALIRQLTRE